MRGYVEVLIRTIYPTQLGAEFGHCGDFCVINWYSHNSTQAEAGVCLADRLTEWFWDLVSTYQYLLSCLILLIGRKMGPMHYNSHHGVKWRALDYVLFWADSGL